MLFGVIDIFAFLHASCYTKSVLGLILFTMHIIYLSTIIDSHSIMQHLFTDLQLQMTTLLDKISKLSHRIQACIGDIKAWSTANMLKSKDNKTELMRVTSKEPKK